MNQKFVDGVCVLCSVLTVFLWTFVLAGVLLAPGCTLLDDDPSNDPSPQQIATVIQSGARAVTGIALSQVDADERVEIALEVKDRAGQVQYYLNAVLDNGSPATAAIDILRKNFIRLLPPDLQVYVLTGLDSLATDKIKVGGGTDVTRAEWFSGTSTVMLVFSLTDSVFFTADSVK